MHKLRMPVLISSYIPHQFHSYAHPCGISDHLLSHARAQRQYVQLAIFAADEAAEQEAARGAGKEDVAIERTGKCGGHKPFAPNLIANAIIADARRYTHRDEARGGEGRNRPEGPRVGKAVASQGKSQGLR